MKQRWTFRCYPTDAQAREPARTFGCVWYVYNWGLEQRTKAFQRGERMNHVQSSAALSALRAYPSRGDETTPHAKSSAYWDRL